MKVAMIGTGYVGLVSGTCFAEFGFPVVCCDKNPSVIEKLEHGQVPIYEPGLEALIAKNVKAGRMTFTTDITSAVQDADIVFIAVGTPTNSEDGTADLSYVMAASAEIARALKGYTAIVIKSTVPVDTNQRIARLIHDVNPGASFDVVSNPEFLREGSAIADFMSPDRVVIGLESERAKEKMQALYAPLANQNVPIIYTTPVSAELIKYVSNCFLATKITFINEVSDLCEKTGANIKEVSNAVGLDHRIGKPFLNPGPGYGGSCFPKDTLALAETARLMGAPLTILDTVITVNKRRKQQMAQRILEALTPPHRGKKVAILGITFKADTDDIRDSASLDIIPILQDHGVQVSAYDPEGMPHGQNMFQNVSWAENAYEAIKDADAIVIMTEWNEFKSLDLTKMKSLARSPSIIDLRNLYTPDAMRQAGFTYIPLGMPMTAPSESNGTQKS